jgi:dsDNA-binding SOS-regulon protein
MSVNVPKSYQNDKDNFMSQVKDNYDKMLDKFYRYKLMLGNAVTKFTAYIKNAVK